MIRNTCSFFTSSSDGLIFLTGRDNFLAVYLADGRVSLSFQNLLNQQAISTDRYDDSELHTIQFTHINSEVYFVIDGREQPTITGFPTGQSILI